MVAKDGWDRFEWDDASKKKGNVQHLRDHEIEPEEAPRNVSSTTTPLRVMIGASTMFTFWMAEPIMEGN
jgi:hypothetical protein